MRRILNVVLLLVLISIQARSAAAVPQLVIADPSGDNFNPAADVTNIYAEIVGTNLVITVNFATLNTSNAYASINLDTDQNQGTGRFPPANGSASQTVGVEFELFLDIYNSNAQPTPLVLVLDGPTRGFLFAHPMSIVGNAVTVTIPLSEIGNDDGNMNLACGAVNGTAGLFADLAPDSGHGTLTASADTTRPTVSSVVPANAATGVVRDTSVQINFSEALDPTTVTGSSVTLKQGATPVAGTLSLGSGNSSVTFTPSSNLAANTSYTVTATTAITDVAGNPLDGNGGGGNLTSGFTTGTGFGLPVLATDPTGDASGPHDFTAIRVGETATTLTIRLDFATFTASNAWGSINLDVDQNPSTGTNPPVNALPAHTLGADYELWLDIFNLNGRPVPVAFLRDGNTNFLGPEYPMTLGPTSLEFTFPLADIGESADGNFDLTAHVVTASTSMFSDHLPGSGKLTYNAVIDRIAPQVLAVSPPDSTDNVAVNVTPSVTFDGALNPATVTSASVRLVDTSTGTDVPATLGLSSGNSVVTITPNAPLDDQVVHRIRVTTAVTDAAGNPLPAEFTSVFETADITPPVVLSVSPGSGQTGIPVTSSVFVIFSEPVAGVDRDNLRLTVGTHRIAGTYMLMGNGSSALFTPLLPLTGATTYTVQITTAVEDLSGNPLNGGAGSYSTTFTTAATAPPDQLTVGSAVIPVWKRTVVIPVSLTSTFPAGGVSFRISYDPAVLSYGGLAEAKGRATGMEVVSASESSPGVLGVVMLASLSGGPALPAGSGSILELTFDIDSSQPGGILPLTVSAAEISESRGLAFATLGVTHGSLHRDPSVDVPRLPTMASLGQPTPNPFNPTVTFPLELPVPGRARVEVYDARGTLVRTLADRDFPAGVQPLQWDGRDNSGRSAASGVYYVRLSAANGEDRQKVVLVR